MARGQRRCGHASRHTASAHEQDTTIVIDLTGDMDADAEGEDCNFIDLTMD